jgi:selenocysteine lyase/cysteine desulfurase
MYSLLLQGKYHLTMNIQRETKKEAFTTDEIATFRRETRGCAHVNHLNNAGASLMPDVVTQAVVDHLTLESVLGGYEAAAQAAADIRMFYDRMAALLRCKPANIAFTTNATDSYIRALSSIPFQEGDVILTDIDDYISNQIQFLSLRKRWDLRVEHIRNAAEGGVDLQDLAEKLDRLQPRLLAITHIPTNSGLMQPVEAIAAIYQQYRQTQGEKTWYILDACQSAGQVALDVQALGCDFLSATSRKFLRGPRGAGFLYVSDRSLSSGLEPLFIDMRGAKWTGKDSYEAREDATRFEDWEFAYALMLGTSAAIDYCLRVGVDRIRLRVDALSARMRLALAGIDRVTVLDKGAQRAGLVTFTVKGFPTPGFLVDEMRKRKINVVASYREFAVIDFGEKNVDWAIRASPHYFNTEEEVDVFIDTLKAII